MNFNSCSGILPVGYGGDWVIPQEGHNWNLKLAGNPQEHGDRGQRPLSHEKCYGCLSYLCGVGKGTFVSLCDHLYASSEISRKGAPQRGGV